MPQRFQDRTTFTERDVTEALRRNDPDELRLVPITVALLSMDPSLAARSCLRFVQHNDPLVRGNALLALGHVARRFRTLDEAAVKPLLEAALHDQEGAVRECAQSASDEIHQFLHWTIAGHRYG
jgi:hypothetical protein